MTYAVLRPSEQECGSINHKHLYQFKYDEKDNFFILIEGEWEEEISTAFNFLNVME